MATTEDTRQNTALAELFGKLVVRREDGCWGWSGCFMHGYAVVNHSYSCFSARRLSWEFANGPIPEDCIIVLTCETEGCLNPEHMAMDVYGTRSPWTKERFYRKVDKSTPEEDGCWLWKACLNKTGYGIARVNTKNKLAHRMAYEFEYGPIPDGLIVRHTCHNPACVRPSHLLTGTQQDNMDDKVLAGRQPKGDNSPVAKLTSRDVVYVLEQYMQGKSAKAIATELGRSYTCIWCILKGKLWVDVPRPPGFKFPRDEALCSNKSPTDSFSKESAFHQENLPFGNDQERSVLGKSLEVPRRAPKQTLGRSSPGYAAETTPLP